MADNQSIWRRVLDELLKGVRHFWMTATALAKDPRAFFAQYFASAGARFNEAPQGTGAITFPYMQPFAFLGYAIGISAAVLTVTQYAILDIARREAHRFQPGFTNVLEQVRGADPAREAAKRGVLYIDFGALTGIPILDPTIADAAQFAAYALFAVLLWNLAQRLGEGNWPTFAKVDAMAQGREHAGTGAPKELTVKAIVHCFAYLVGLVLFAQAAVHFVLAVLQLTVGIGLQAFMAVDAVTSLAFGLYILAMPAFVLSDIFDIRQSTLIKATLWAFGIWVVGGVILGLILNASGVWIRNFGLHLGL
jgi:hypothetical protein